MTCHFEEKIQFLKAINQLKRIPLNVGQRWTKDKAWMPENPHFGRVKVISSGGHCFLSSLSCRGQWQPSSLRWAQSAGSQKEREIQQNRLWSVVKQRNARKFITNISTAKKKLCPRAHSATHYHKDMPQQWLWAWRWWKQDDHGHAFLLLGLEVEAHSIWGSVILMQHYIAQYEYVLGESLKTDQLTQSCLNYHFVLHITVAHNFWCIEIFNLKQYLKTNPAPLTWKKAFKKSFALAFFTFNPYLCKNTWFIISNTCFYSYSLPEVFKNSLDFPFMLWWRKNNVKAVLWYHSCCVHSRAPN